MPTPTVFTAPATLGEVLKHEYHADFCREVVILEASATGYALGAVLGRKTADGVFALSPATGDTGTETACAVLVEAVDPGVTSGVAVVRGPVLVSDAALAFDTTVNTDTLKTQKHTQLAAFGLVVRHAV